MELDFTWELKSVTEAGQFEGLASTYDTDEVGDRILPGAFTKSLADRGAQRPVLWAHDMAQPVGLGTLMDAPEGLRILGSLDLDVTAGREALSRVKKGIVRGLSIGYRIPQGGAETKDGIRLLNTVDVMEVSLVAVPANRRAQILGVKSLDSIRAYEDFLHNAGFSKREARALAAVGWKGLAQQPTEEDVLLDALRKLNAA